MRRFIYYDKDGIESYLAQITGGISISSSKEITTGQEKSKITEKSKNINSDIGAKIAGIGAEIKEDIEHLRKGSKGTNSNNTSGNKQMVK